jgi:phosphoglycerol transferase MdoB-like AlkP superfamily enzyme
MELKIKKIIAREGLIILGIIVYVLLLLFLGKNINSQGIRNLIPLLLILPIVIYFYSIPIRFIIWAIKTLRQKK